jgi:hypothetical protein
MDAFEAELMRRSPLAACVLELSDFVFDDGLLKAVWDAHRGRCYQDVLKFGDFLRLMRDALVRHGGSAHRLFVGLERRDAAPVDESNFYRKLARTPVELSRALLRAGAARLATVMPRTTTSKTSKTSTTAATAATAAGAGVTLPACFDAFAAIVGDGKKLKNAAKRLAPTRGFSGKLIGAKALVALDLRSGLAVAMHDSLDGMANDVPLVPGLMAQLRELIADRPILSVWDRQFDDVGTMRHLSARPGDAFVVRVKQAHARFAVESSVESSVESVDDDQGRRVRDEVGVLGKGKRTMRVRRVTLFRRDTAAAAAAGDGGEDVVLLTNLLDRAAHPAAALLALYKERWGIERVFQQVTETFALSHLIGSSPKAVLLQFAFCLLLYDLMQVVRAYVARDGRVLASAVSMSYLFADVRDELTAWAYHTDGTWPRARRDADGMRDRLRALLRGSWDPVAYPKAADKKPRPKPPPPRRLHGGHTSVQRLLEGKVTLAAK